MKISVVKAVKAYVLFPARWGTTPQMPGRVQRHLVLCNLISWVILHYNTAYFVYDFIYFGHFLRSATSLLIIFFAGFTLWLNKNGFHFLGRSMSAFIYSTFVFVYGIAIKFVADPSLIHFISPRIPLIMFVFFPFLFLDMWKEKWAFGITYGLNVVYVVGYDPLHQLLGIDLASMGLELENYHVLTQNSITFLINISLGFVFLKFVNHRFEQRIERLNQVLRKRSLSIQARNEALEQQKKKIEVLKDNLEALVEARTTKLAKRNQQLSEYAHWNAHKLRAPVATMLGLLELISIENADSELARHPYFLHLKQSAEELDAIIREMQNKVNEGEKD